jgi:hypothetical protein
MIMKRTILILLLVLLLSLMAFGPAFAQAPMHCGDPSLPGHSGFGQHHAGMGRAGELGKDMHPGMHRGNSSCLP